MQKQGLEGFIRVTEAPPHQELEKVAKTIDVEGILEATIQAAIELSANKAYRTQGGQDPLFREIAKMLLEYGFVYPRPPAIPKNRVGFIIAIFEGL